jgi:hypothetical protein
MGSAKAYDRRPLSGIWSCTAKEEKQRSEMNEVVRSLESLSQILVFVSASIGIVGALIQYRLKVKAEDRLRNLAVLETDKVKKQILMGDPRALGQMAQGALIAQPVPLPAQVAAAESIANLAIAYPFLLEPALAGLDVVVGFVPQAKNAYDRLSNHYGVQRPLTDWGFSPNAPNWGYEGGSTPPA